MPHSRCGASRCHTPSKAVAFDKTGIGHAVRASLLIAVGEIVVLFITVAIHVRCMTEDSFLVENHKGVFDDKDRTFDYRGCSCNFDERWSEAADAERKASLDVAAIRAAAQPT